MIGGRITAFRKKIGLSQKELAQALNVTAGAVSQWEHDRTMPDTMMLPHLASVLGTTVSALMGEQEQQPRTISDADIKFALFGGDNEITDAQFEEVKRYALYLKERGRNDGRSPR